MVIQLTAIKNKACSMKIYDRKKRNSDSPDSSQPIQQNRPNQRGKKKPQKNKHLRVRKRVGKEERNFT